MEDTYSVGCTQDGQRWLIIFDDSHRADALRQLGKWAADPKLDFSWYSAAVLAQRIRQGCVGNLLET